MSTTREVAQKYIILLLCLINNTVIPRRYEADTGNPFGKLRAILVDVCVFLPCIEGSTVVSQ